MTSKATSPDFLNIPAWRLRLALLARADEELRGYVQQAGTRAADIKRQILRGSEVRPVRVRGLPGARVHLMAMPALLDFGAVPAICPADTRLFTSGSGVALRMQEWWRAALGGQRQRVWALPRAVLLEAVLGISPTAVHEFVFYGASLMEGAREEPAKLQLADRYARQAEKGLVAPYLLMALVAGAGDPALDETAWRRCRSDGEALLRAMFATPQASPAVTLLPPRRFFDAIHSAQEAQLADASAWVTQNHGALSLTLHAQDGGLVEIECRYELPEVHRAGRMIWRYDGFWREPPDLGAITGLARPTEVDGGACLPPEAFLGQTGRDRKH